MARESCYKVDFSHIKREGNSPAHLLVKYDLGIDDYETWMEASPCFLEQTLIHGVFFLVWSLIKVQYTHPKKETSPRFKRKQIINYVLARFAYASSR